MAISIKYETGLNINNLEIPIEEKQTFYTNNGDYNIVFFNIPEKGFRYKNRVYLISKNLTLIDDENIGIQVNKLGNIFLWVQIEN